MAFDFKKEYKEFYMPKNKPGIVTVPSMNYIAVRGQGDPNTEDGEYKQSIGLLYGIAFTIKMSKKGDHQIDEYYDYIGRRWRAFGGRMARTALITPIRKISNGSPSFDFLISLQRKILNGRSRKPQRKRKPISPRLSFLPMTRANAFSVCTSAPMMMSQLLSHLCTSIWRARGMLWILRTSACIMKSISVMQGGSLPKS